MKKSIILLGIAGLIIALNYSRSEKQPVRTDMAEIVDRNLEALNRSNPSHLPMAEDVRLVENSEKTPFGGVLLKTASGEPADLKETAAGPNNPEVPLVGTIEENEKPTITGIRPKTAEASAQQVKLLEKSHDPNGYPRPGKDHTNVPLLTTYYIELQGPDSNADPVDPASITLSLTHAGGTINILDYYEQFQPGYPGRIFHRSEDALCIYADSTVPLLPSTQYAVRLTAMTAGGATLAGGEATWAFTTETAPATHAVNYVLDLSTASTQWDGGFFTGFCKPSFNTSIIYGRVPGYELMDAVRQRFPRAWSLQRDWWITGFQYAYAGFPDGRGWWVSHPNIVRERETRRITGLQDVPGGTELSLEHGFFGSEQYGIPWGRNLSLDYDIGDEVLIADGSYNNARVFVAAIDDAANTMLVTTVPHPAGGWQDYTGELPTTENPGAPGLFPPGGIYLRKFNPAGTQHYYWDRMDTEWDVVHGRFGRRLVVNFCDGAGDLSIDGGEFTTAKDLVAQREATYQITSRLISRYGAAALDFLYSVGNEPDLASHFWRNAGWDEFQRFYDYTVDGVLRAFEDHGYDSSQVKVGGVEIGAIFGTNIAGPILGKMLGHCSPTATYSGALPLNAAYADPRLTGKLSQRVVDLCSANGGAGSPIDFISIHGYNRSSLFAAKLEEGKRLALSIDPTYYADLWVGSHESCPDWAPPPDVAAHEAYLGNGYFSTWCADIVRRQINKAVTDSRYGFGETILTFWPWVDKNFNGLNGVTEIVSIDENQDGLADRDATVGFPLLHFLGLIASMDGAEYRVFPSQSIGGHLVSGISAESSTDLRIMLYSHHELDTQARSDRRFEVTINLNNLPWVGPLHVQQYGFDKDRNSIYRLALDLRDRVPFEGGSAGAQVFTPQDLEQLEALSAMRVTDDAYITPTGGDMQLVVPVSGNGANFIVIDASADSIAPSVAMSSSAGDPTNLSSIPVTVLFDEPVTGFSATDLVLFNATMSSLSGSGADYKFNLVPADIGLVTVDIPADAAFDSAGNGNAPAQFSRVFDITATGGDPDFSISASPTSASILAGNPARFTLAISPINGSTAPVSLSCAGAPAHSTCSIAPATVALDGIHPSSASVTVSTTARTMMPSGTNFRTPYLLGPVPLLWLMAMFLLGTLAFLALKRRWILVKIGIIALCVLVWAGCDESSTSTVGTPAGDYTLTLTGTAGTLAHSTGVTLRVR